MSDKEQKAKTLLEEGKLALSKNEYSTSIAKLSEACQLLDEINGCFSPANGDAFFLYGEALLQYAIKQSTVLGQSAQENVTSIEGAESSKSNTETKPDTEDNDDLDEDDFDEDDSDDEQKPEEEEEAKASDDDFETAWDILDVARVIFEKDQNKESQLKLADVHLCLGDVSLETEKFDEALVDYKKAVEIKKLLLEEDDRQLAEAYYKYSLALEFSSNKSDQALPQIQNAVDVLKKRIEKLEKDTSDSSKKILDEIKEIKEIIPDMELKIEELSDKQSTEKEANELLKAMLSKEFSKGNQISEATPVNDLSTLIKRKVKEVIKEEESKDKKQKLE